ncbi:MAG: 50S ribosomal protein L32 [Candidatus Nomurabacteria bacterium GW2011_GWB1_37_5]|uniref:Large ribosomal subunit protein bL32 n=1 Tax=Candidatus Nomurabacteria bacterium GW2011_GWB1_37_5 TaxID=1618742 RepID=A0A0G0JE32_9BACT|nr:MAG: 50S ribosomal protein L32 [Candidatus Nomurabacteria bacterium GW2011_GWB1_37_5]
MVIRMRHTRAHTANRRSHHALKTKNFFKCEKCSKPKLGHTACGACGFYRGKEVVNKVAVIEKKQSKSKRGKQGK